MNKGELTAEALSRILQIHTDRINAYKKALSKSKRLELDLKVIFERMIEESMRFKNELNSKLNASNGVTLKDFFSKAKSQNNWIGTKAILTADRRNILTGCALDEEMVGDAYINALALDNQMDSSIGQLLIAQLESSEVLRQNIKKYHSAQ